MKRAHQFTPIVVQTYKNVQLEHHNLLITCFQTGLRESRGQILNFIANVLDGIQQGFEMFNLTLRKLLKVVLKS